MPTIAPLSLPNLDDCPHRPPCPGCPRFGDTSPPVAAQSALRKLAAAAGLPAPPIHTSPGLGHRHRARLAVRGRAKSPKIGLFQAGSHRIADTPRCGVHHPKINETIEVLKRAIRKTGIAPYADKPHVGALRYVQVVVERSTERVQVVLVGNGHSKEVLGDLPAVFESELGDRLQGLFFNAQPERSNAILGPNMTHISGKATVTESLGGVEVHFPPGAFGQNHLPLYQQAVDRIATLVPDGLDLAEAYCGVGSIGLGLLGRARSMRFNERSGDGLAGLSLGLSARPESERARATIFEGAAGERLDAVQGADLVLVDPPRKGLDAALLDELVANPPKRLIYLACGLPALLAEIPRLESGGLRLRGVEAFDFFPFTEHVETLVWLDRDGEQFETRRRSPNRSLDVRA